MEEQLDNNIELQCWDQKGHAVKMATGWEMETFAGALHNANEKTDKRKKKKKGIGWGLCILVQRFFLI